MDIANRKAYLLKEYNAAWKNKANFNESVHKTIAKEDEIILCNESITSL